MPPAASDKYPCDRGRKVDLRGGDRGRDDGCHSGGGVSIRKHFKLVEKAAKVIAVKAFWRRMVEPWVLEDGCDEGLIHLALRGQSAAFVAWLAKAGKHQVVQGRIGRSGVEGQKRAGAFGAGGSRVDPGQVAHAAKVEKGQGSGRADETGEGKVEEGRKRRALPAHRHVRRTEIPDRRQVQCLGQDRTIAALMGAPTAGVMCKGLAVKPQDLGPGEPGQKLGMRILDHFGGGDDIRVTRPLAKRRAKHGLFLHRIGAIGSGTKGIDGMTVGLDHGGINPIQRGAGHGPQGPKLAFLPHLPLARLQSYTAPILDRGSHELPSEI